MKVPFYRPALSEREHELVHAVLESGWITTGPMVARMEALVKQHTHAVHAIAFPSCTVALYSALTYARMLWEGRAGRKGHPQVITTPLTFVGTAQAIEWAGASPLFVDVTADGQLNWTRVHELRSNGNVMAILPVHYAGGPAWQGEWAAWCPVIYDAAHAIALHGVGLHGEAACFSFYANKNATSGEGGCVTTNNENYAAWLRKFRNHGFAEPVGERYKNPATWRQLCVQFGINGHLSDIQAAVAVGQLERLPELQLARWKRIRWYDARLEGLVKAERIRILPHDEPHGAHLYVIEVTGGDLSRDELIWKLAERGVSTSVHYPLVTEHPPYKQPTPPMADRLAAHILSLPMFPTMSEDECQYVCDGVCKCLA
jgi:dTDP-4-amino-4,6-dideoxygalactose transaminase